MKQDALMKFDPATGGPNPYPSHACQWREHCRNTAWLFDPWTGEQRRAQDVFSDIVGFDIVPHGEVVDATYKPKPKAPPNTRGKKASRGKRSAVGGAKYADKNGNTWVGRGKRPGWLRDALAGGAELESFRV